MKHTNVSIMYLFYKDFINLEIKVALISYILSKAALKAAKNKGLITLINHHLATGWQYPDGSGLWANRWWLPPQPAVTECSLADRVFSLWYIIAGYTITYIWVRMYICSQSIDCLVPYHLYNLK